MSIVVCDTSPLRALAHLRLLRLPALLYGELLIPPVVADELRRPVIGSPSVDPLAIPGGRIRAPADRRLVETLRRTLDEGESEAIALAIETPASVLLIDERAGRLAAARLNLKTMGVLAVLVDAKLNRHVENVGILIETLQREIAFRISPAIIRQVLAAANET